MVFSFSLLLLAFAVSLDSFSAGLTYGLRKMQIPMKSILVIAGCSAFSLLSGMGLGNLTGNMISPDAAEKIGGVVLILLGGWILFQFIRPEKSKEVLPQEKTIVNLEIKSLGLVIQILKRPMSADFDQSGTITGMEAILLGLALSLDAFGAGIGAAMLGFSPAGLAFSVAVMSSFFVFLGMKIGEICSNSLLIHKCSFIPGLLLIFIGVWKM